MQLTKYSHSCALLSKDNANLLIDPGILTDMPEYLPRIDVLVITHVHDDHLDMDKINHIIYANPDVLVFGPAEVADKITQPQVTIPKTNRDYPAGPFNLRFYGGQHAQVHPSKPSIGNFGVGIDGEVYYPGDSFTRGPSEIKVLLAPAAAPWMKVAEGIDYITEQRAKLVVPTHDAILSTPGKMFYDAHFSEAAEKAGGNYRRLEHGDVIDV